MSAHMHMMGEVVWPDLSIKAEARRADDGFIRLHIEELEPRGLRGENTFSAHLSDREARSIIDALTAALAEQAKEAA